MAQALLNLLQSQGYIQLEAEPSLVAKPGEQSEVRLTSYTEDPAQPLHYRELGTTVRVTAHLPATGDDLIRLKVAAEVNEPVPPTQSNNHLGVRHSQIVTEIIVPEDRYVSLLVDASDEMPTDANDPKATLVLLKARIDKPGSTPTDDSGAQAEKQSHQPQRVILNARVVEIENSNLAKLEMEFDHPVSRDRQVPKNADWIEAISIGCVPDQMSTDILLTRLNQLEATHQAKIVGNPRSSVQDGHPFEVQSVPDEWFVMTTMVEPNSFATSGKIVPGTILTVTPHVGDSNKIMLDLEVGITIALRPEHDAEGMPILGRAQVKSRVTVQDGGTVVIAGLVRGSGMSNGKPTKKVAIFVTAQLIPQTSEIPQKINGA